MLKALMVAVMLCTVPAGVFAQDTQETAASSAAVSADSLFGSIWNDLKANSSFHAFDNAAPLWGQDFINGQQLVGVSSAFYYYRFISVDGQMLKKSDVDLNVFPGVGPNLHGDMLLKEVYPAGYDSLSRLFPSFDKAKLSTGVSLSRDFYDHLWRVTWYAGVDYRFGS